MLTQWRIDDGFDASKGGRPSLISQKSLLIVFLILALEGAPLHVSQMASIFHHRLTRRASIALGVTPESGDYTDWYHRTSRAMRRMLDIMDPHPETPRRRSLLREEFFKIRDGRDEEFVASRKARLQQFTDALISATVRLVPAEVMGRWKGDVAIDGTFIRASRRGTNKEAKYASSEPDAGWHVRDHKPLGDNAPRGERKWGWELHISTMFSPGDDAGDFPNLILGMTIDRPAFSPDKNAIKALQNQVNMGLPRRYVVTDMLYFPGMKPERYAIPAKELGFQPVGTMRKGEAGLQEQFKGAKLIDGNWYSPGIPDNLVTATERYWAGEIDTELHKKLIKRRRHYMLRTLEIKPNSQTKMGCPALGPSPTVTCVLRDLKRNQRGQLPHINDANSPEGQDPICVQHSITPPNTTGAKYALPQNVQWGSVEFYDIFSYGRNTIESTNARLKAGNGEMIEDRTRRMMRGLAAHSVFSAALIAVYNIRAREQFLAAPDRPATAKKRKTRSELRAAVDVIETGLLIGDPANAPPQAA